MPGKTNGFTLLEMIAAITIVALMAALLIPVLRRKPVAAKKKVLEDLNSLTRIAQTNAIISHKIHRIFFSLKDKKAVIEFESKKDSQDKSIYTPLKIPYVKTAMHLPANTSIEHFVIKGKDLMREKDFAYKEAWFYIMPNGMAQEVSIGLFDEQQNQNFNVIINPFTARFAYDTL